MSDGPTPGGDRSRSSFPRKRARHHRMFPNGSVGLAQSRVTDTTRGTSIDSFVEGARWTRVTASDARRDDPLVIVPRSTRRHISCISNSCRHPGSPKSSLWPSNGNSDTRGVWSRLSMIATDSGCDLSCNLQGHASMRAGGRVGRRAQESAITFNIRVPRSVVVRESSSSTGEGRPTLLNVAVSGLPLPDSLWPDEPGVARPIAVSTRLGDRRRSVHRIESLDGDPLEWCRQQRLDVAQEPRIRCRHE